MEKRTKDILEIKSLQGKRPRVGENKTTSKRSDSHLNESQKVLSEEREQDVESDKFTYDYENVSRERKD